LFGDNLLFLQALIPYKMMVITLTASDEVLLARARTRSTGFADERVIKEMNSWFLKNANETIDTSTLTANEVTQRIIDIYGLT